MITLDTNILARYLVQGTEDDEEQAEAARELLQALTPEQPGFIPREVAAEFAWVLARSYQFSRDQIATTFEELLATAGLVFEEANDVARAASRYRKDGAGFADLMILAAATRTNALPVLTFDRKMARFAEAQVISPTGP